MTQPAVLLIDRDLIKDVLIKNFSSFEANEFVINEKHDALLTANPFFIKGAAWKRQRSLMQPLFSLSKVNDL